MAKSQQMEDFLESLAGRTTAKKYYMCVEPPFGCGKMVGKFKDRLSEKEYSISGLCQRCQDKVFG